MFGTLAGVDLFEQPRIARLHGHRVVPHDGVDGRRSWLRP